MATIDLGRLGFVNKGTYNNSTTYEKNDLVQFTDSGILSTYLYIDSTAQSGQAPSSSGTVGSRWVYFAKGVADAIAGAGNNKVLVTDGSGNLSPLAIGSAGLALKVNSGANGFEFGSAGKATEVLVNADEDVGNVGNGSYFMTWNFTPTISGKIFLSHHGSHRFAGSGGEHMYCIYEFNNGSGFITLATLGVGYGTSAPSHNQGWAYASVIPTTSDSDSTTVVTVTAGTQCTFRCKANSGNTANAAQDGGQDHVMSAIIYET